MLVFADGSQIGTLGGGCVEAEVKQKALRILMDRSQPQVLSFCLDDDYGWDDGLICGGRMNILADPLQHPGTRAYYNTYRELVEKGSGSTESVIVADTVAGASVGSRYLFDSGGALVSQLASGPVPEVVLQHLTPLERRPAAAMQQGIAYLPILPRITLLIVGGGHVGQAVARLAAETDFEIWALDDREAYASRARFPTARRLIVGDIGNHLQQLAQGTIDRSFFCLIVTRGHAHDEEALYHLANCQAGYVGMIGSKRKIRMIFEDLLARGISLEALERVHAPLGFSIGSQTVPEIAVSIVAELIACRNLGSTIPTARQWVKPGTARP